MRTVDHTNTIPEVFGASWTKFVDEWCLGTPPFEPSEVCARALRALVKHLPEHVQRVLTGPSRGLGIIAGNIDLGLTLDDTESLSGFVPVVARLRAGERGAGSELTVAAALAQIGFSPALQVETGTKRPDLAITVGNSPVYGEVIAPDRAEVVKETTDRMGEIATAILSGCDGANIELFLDFDPERIDIALASKFIADSPQTLEPAEVPEVGRFVKRPFTFPPITTPSIDRRTSGTVMGVARSSIRGTGGSLVAVRAPVFDGRAKRLLTAELHHFSKNAPNFVAINCGDVSGGMSDWASSLARCFQPKQNTRISAVLLYHSGLIGNPLQLHRAWKVLVNPHAANPLPDALLKAFESLPNKWPH